MKKVILITAAIIFFVTPCMAQTDVESWFSVDTTVWLVTAEPNNPLGFKDGNAFWFFTSHTEYYKNAVLIDGPFSLFAGKDLFYNVWGLCSPLVGTGIIFYTSNFFGSIPHFSTMELIASVY